jgi:LPXTG-site transpeptidase (sortase) family protein
MPHSLRASRPHRGRGVSAVIAPVLVLCGLFGLAMGLGQVTGLPQLWAGGAKVDSSTALAHSPPNRITIAAIGVRAKVVSVGTASDGSIAVPTDASGQNAGWYSHSPTPGEQGTSVIVGHVDTAAAPAVFAELKSLRKGKLIEVTREDRRVAVFRVDSVETYPKTSFPAGRVFAATGAPRLVLVTCGGAWVGGETGYADNVIVFASWAGSAHAP